jgi:hypothetical protein
LVAAGSVAAPFTAAFVDNSRESIDEGRWK